MTRSAFIRQAPVATGARVLSATNEAGRTVVAPVSSTSNRGALQLRGSGSPLSSVVLDLALTQGGNVTGYALASGSMAPGAAVRYKNSTDGSTSWRGWIDPNFLTWAQMAVYANATADTPGMGRIRTLGNGSMGFAVTKRPAVGAQSIEFGIKATRTGTWTMNSVTTATPEAASCPDFIVFPSGRIVLFYMLEDRTVRAVYSDDHGTTWATWSNNTNVGPLLSGSKQLSVELVDDGVCLVASMAPGATTRGANVYWSWNGGASFAQAGTAQTWGPTRTTVTRNGEVLAIASDQSANAGGIWQIPMGAAPVATSLGTAVSVNALNVSPAIVCHDDGTLWAYGGTTSDPTPSVYAAYSDDSGRTWRTPATGATTTTGIAVADTDGGAEGFNNFAAGTWDGRIVLLAVTDVSTGAQDDAVYEMHFGGWDTLTEAVRTVGTDAAYATGYHPIDSPTVLGWTGTDIGAGATTAIGATGWTITSGGATNTYYTAPTTIFSSGTGAHGDGIRIKGAFSVASGGSIADDRTLIFQVGFSDGTNEQSIKLRATDSQLRLVDGSGATLATSLSVASVFNAVTEYIAFFEKNTTSTTGTVSLYYRAATATSWTALCTGATVTEAAGSATAYLLFGGTAAGASEWTTHFGPLVADDDNDLALGFTNPNDLAGRKLDAASDLSVTQGHRLGGAGGAGMVGDTFTWTTDAQYHRRWLWSHLRPSQRHQATGDNATHDIVTDVGTNAPPVEFVGLVGTNFRTASISLNSADSWGSPPVTASLDATVWQGTVSTAGLGYVTVDGAPFTPRQWQSEPLRRFFLETSSAVYEISGNTANGIEVTDVDLSAVTGTIRVFGDRMGAFVPESRYRYSRIRVTAQQTADDAYRVASYLMGNKFDLTQPIANGYVDELDPLVDTVQSETGQRFSSVRGTTPRALRIAFDPIDGVSSGLLRELRAMYRATRGEHEVVGFLRDVNRPNEILLCNVFGPLAVENVYGNAQDELGRVAQLILREVL